MKKQYLACFYLQIAGLTAQVPARIVKTPLPLWTANIAPTQDATNASAFLDLKRNQVVVFAPEQGSTMVRERRFDIGTGASSDVNWQLTDDRKPTVQYAYIVSEKAGQPQTLAHFSIRVLDGSSTTPVNSATQWQFASPKTDGTSLTASVGPQTRVASWRILSPVMRPRAAEFAINSGYLPGFSDAYVQGATPNPLTEDTIQTLPSNLADKVRRFLEPSFNGEHHLVIAPLFPAETGKIKIAANFHYGLSSLVRRHELTANSPYVQQTLSILSQYIAAAQDSRLPMPTATPTTSREMQIQRALALAFTTIENGAY